MNDLVPVYRELYSISDLHMGGSLPGMQMFRQGKWLKAFIESLASTPGPFALVIAGDVIDSLPYLKQASSYIAMDTAAIIMRTVMNDASFTDVFDGLRTFLKSKGRELIVMTGNHDLELAVPEVQEELLGRVAPTASARGRVRFVTNGTGFRCRIGDLRVLVTHGHEADYWNHVDYEALRKATHARALGLPFDAGSWIPNAGTKLVVDVMNAVKERHPFIDLLKPENKAALKVLSVLAPETVTLFFDALPAFAKAARAFAGPHVVLGAAGDRLAVAEPRVVQLLEEAVDDTVSVSGQPQSRLLERVARLQQEGKSPTELVDDSDGSLGRLRYILDRVTGKAPSAALRTALQGWVSGDSSFHLQNQDDTYRGILKQLGVGIDVVITGHTHLPRWIAATEPGNLTYLNAGTWARLIGLRNEFFESDAAFEPVYHALMSPDIRTLDNTVVNTSKGAVPLVLDATAAAHVAVQSDGTARARLVRIVDRNGSQTIEEVNPNTSVLTWL